MKNILKIFPDSFAIKNNKVNVGGVDLQTIVNKIGTPAFIYCRESLEARMSEYTKNFKSRKFSTKVFYASKAFASVGMLQIAERCGIGVDVSTMGELQTAIKAGSKAENIIFHGNNKSNAEIRTAIKYGVGRFVIDSFDEIVRLKMHASRKAPQKVMIRVTPGIKASTHKYLTTGTADSKFAFLLTAENALRAVKEVNIAPQLELTGFHFHIGSQIFELGAYPEALLRVAKWIAEHREAIALSEYEINLGGGLGIRYTVRDDPPKVKEYCRYLITECERILKVSGLKVSTLMIEPGRSIVGNAGFTLYSVGTVKESGEKTFVSVDGGMSDNMRPALYGSKYEVLNLTRSNMLGQRKCVLVGKHCETGDVLIDGAEINDPSVGDLLAVPATGAYCYAMANNYNRLGRPAVVLAGNGKFQLLIARESSEDVLRNDKMLKN